VVNFWQIARILMIALVLVHPEATFLTSFQAQSEKKEDKGQKQGQTQSNNRLLIVEKHYSA